MASTTSATFERSALFYVFNLVFFNHQELTTLTGGWDTVMRELQACGHWI